MITRYVLCWFLSAFIAIANGILGFGHCVAGHSWSRLLAEYNLSQGRVWLLFLVWSNLMPYAFFKVSQ